MRINTCFNINIIIYVLMGSLVGKQAYAVDFNTDVLDAEDRNNIDFSRFSQAGYILPGHYQMEIMVNDQNISPSTFQVNVVELPTSEGDGEKKKPLPQACLTPDMVERMGLTASALEKVKYQGHEQCANFQQLPGVEVHPNPPEGTLHINIPQAWLEYSDASWLPPSRWDNGIPGLLFDYNISGTVNQPHQGKQSQSVGYNGTAGINFTAWRLRADYQGNLNHTTGSDKGSESQFTWSRFYMYRAIPHWHANLTLGENYINSEIFSSWRYSGASLESDERMLPPKLRGYAPQVSGIADTNARVVISQQGRILYDSTVPAGPFTVQDLDSSVRGRLDVEVIEQNGQKKTFQVNTAYVPYLTRPGQIRYKLISGRSRSYEHFTEGLIFTAGEASWGISNQWSLYGGAIIAGDYNALAVGVGRDLSEFGTLSADVTQSMARLSGIDAKQGKSWSLRYSKRFDDMNADIQFAGYRFSERNYMTMQQYLDARYRNDFTGREKEQYDLSLNKNLEDGKTSLSLQYSHQTYWDRRTANYYTLSLNRYFDTFGFKNISAGLSASRSRYQQSSNSDGGTYNDSVFLRLSVPWGTGTASYSGSMSNDRYTNVVGYSNTLNGGLDSYSLNAGINAGNGQPSQGQISAYYSHSSPLANLSANFSAAQNNYTSFGMSVSGGATLTTKGAALHAGGMNGGTRLLIDTDGVGDVPVDGGRVSTNRWGIGVVTDVSSYYRNTTSVDLNKLPEDMEATRSVVESVLTEGAIGYREFAVLKGLRLFAVLRLTDNSYPPFGASVTNAKGRELGMIADSGLTWLSGINPGETLNVGWDGKTQCVVDIPGNLESTKQLLLPCRKTK
ncbi:fimbria/pilus outer membrane usher protein [Edwardsiella anguillarum]|uniref:Fimbria/pilus outer membrane usher protein n=1 Tax=Edwardsiella anguillarum TaxID=1821960 RepID=A0ABY8SM09_9GAMM|nr:fimbria/pilus outer membrane usher protein [Edwardsiella anguillarum]WHP85863.1 fimbria/pilus outer membrane usher protein [Edwardsiella anguillarum]WHP89664.1 fimbria/pilus outer membrane usher protein [Edwardsiella anguillarum]WHP93462.1 fimbria/pilus outer membrane usher protein [Edwardsiella anguillarum]WHP97260.1 fimbria/pilus outer membrane usher protein [Edwardsiella anguillarum]WHQ01134.1 fimbria/pilus outer membrane usher protein [Edwardsiella anguillarum]